LALFIGLVTGLLIDVFSDSLGIHMASSVLLMYLRYYVIRWLTPQGGYDTNTLPTVPSMGLQWYITYSLPLILAHHICLFYTEAGGITSFFFTLTKVLSSTAFTLVVIVLFQYLLYSSAKRRI
jgi:hypothetical protein